MRTHLLFAAACCVVSACSSNQNGLFGNTGGQAGSGSAGAAGAAGAPDAGCEQPCVEGEARCIQDGLQTCAADGLGCTSWSAAEACPTDKPFCSNGVCASDCTNECATDGIRACDGAGYRTCGQLDSDPCLDWSQPTACGAGEFCRDLDATCVQGECQPSKVESRGCGHCGGQSRTCSAEGTWQSWSDCSGEGPCAPGATETTSCGVGGTQTRVCLSDCSWGPWDACVEPGDCTPGQTGSESCGNCGVHTRNCTAQGAWGPWGDCSNEGACSAGSKQTQTCNIVGTQTSTCDATCAWGPWGSCAGANPAPQDGDGGVFQFPRTGDASKPGSSSTGFSMTDIGSYVIGVRTTSLASATSLTSTVQYNNYLANSYTCHVTYDIYLNGTKVGSSGAGNQQTSSNVNLTFPPIAGPTYTILYLTTAEPTETGCGALYLKKDTSTVTLQ